MTANSRPAAEEDVGPAAAAATPRGGDGLASPRVGPSGRSRLANWCRGRVSSSFSGEKSAAWAACMPYLVFTALQGVSIITSGIFSWFLTIYVLKSSDSLFYFTLLSLSDLIPSIVMAPVAGWATDKYNKKLVILIADTGSFLCSLFICLSQFGSSGAGDDTLSGGSGLKIRNILIANFLSGFCNSLHSPAVMACFPLLVPERHRWLASFFKPVILALASIVVPVVGGFLVSYGFPTNRLVFIDLSGFLVGVIALLITRIPPSTSGEQENGKSEAASCADRADSTFKKLAFGFRYCWQRRDVRALVAVNAFDHFVLTVVSHTLCPFMLTFASPATMGDIFAACSVGLIIGLALSDAVISRTGNRPLRVALVTMFLRGALMMVVPSHSSWFTLVGVLYLFLSPQMEAAVKVVLTTRVEIDVIGRAYSAVYAVNRIAFAAATIVSGPLIRGVFEPLIGSPTAPLAGTVIGTVYGVGKDRGFNLFYAAFGLLQCISTVFFYRSKTLHELEANVVARINADKKNSDSSNNKKDQ